MSLVSANRLRIRQRTYSQARGRPFLCEPESEQSAAIGVVQPDVHNL